MAVHVLKCATGYFEQVRLGNKTAELRRMDRDYRYGDTLRLEEYEFDRMTGQFEERIITHIVWDSNGDWLAPGYCMLSMGPMPAKLEPLEPPPIAAVAPTYAGSQDCPACRGVGAYCNGVATITC